MKALYLFNYLIRKNFKNKIVVIIGAASGMGKVYALDFAKLCFKRALFDSETRYKMYLKKEA
ncbi:hypothetical protein BST83_02170 [Polaribacter filamentus]|uniref:Uncharacterized protein n=1 Tax=Polaribacter filamentus TaxID=53483 RepID=A0A2S7KU29_9FLAO|nr:hypothetical protein [Polaribacter filamentus]PQB06120.1 hypothetical protein BST83_02170 [Polaribacter filamentus]